MDLDILQSTLEDISHLLIRPSQLTLEDDGELGFGSYGEVFLAVLESSDSQTKVAIKQLRIHVQKREARHRVAIRLARELKVWAKTKHTNILALLGFHLSDDYRCAQLVWEYMANGNVKEYMDKFKPDLATRLRFVQGITSGMSYLHSCNPAICHGGLKPTNVLVNENLDAVLCDSGLARFMVEAGVSPGLTEGKTWKGSPRYTAPELYMTYEPKHTLENDIWAWACTTFEVLTDYRPFHDKKREEAIVAAVVQGQTPGSVDLLDSLVSSGYTTCHITLDSLKSIIPDCWTIDSAKRPSSSEILNRLIFPDKIEALDTATASSHHSATEDRQPELFPPSVIDSQMHGNVKKKRKGSPGLEGRLEKRARGKGTAIGTESVRTQKGNGNSTILMDGESESSVATRPLGTPGHVSYRGKRTRGAEESVGTGDMA